MSFQLGEGPNGGVDAKGDHEYGCECHPNKGDFKEKVAWVVCQTTESWATVGDITSVEVDVPRANPFLEEEFA